MRNINKLIIVCSSMIGVGAVLLIAGYAAGGRMGGIAIGPDGIQVAGAAKKLSYIEENKKLESFDSIDIEVCDGKVSIVPSDHYGVSYCVEEEAVFSAEVEDGCLKISKQYQASNGVVFFGISGYRTYVGGMPKEEYVKVYIPSDTAFDKVRINNEFGDVSCSNFDAGKLELDAEYGNVVLDQVKGASAEIFIESGKLELSGYGEGELSVTNGYGNTFLDDVKATDVTIKMESGKLNMKGMDAERLTISEEYGDVKLSEINVAEALTLYTESGSIKLGTVESGSMSVKSDYGNVVGKDVTTDEATFELESGDCEIDQLKINNLDVVSDYGDVKLVLSNPVSDYALDLDTDYGSVEIKGKDMGEEYCSLEERKNKLRVFCESGNINIK